MKSWRNLGEIWRRNTEQSRRQGNYKDNHCWRWDSILRLVVRNEVLHFSINHFKALRIQFQPVSQLWNSLNLRLVLQKDWSASKSICEGSWFDCDYCMVIDQPDHPYDPLTRSALKWFLLILVGFPNWYVSGCHFQEQVGWGSWLWTICLTKTSYFKIVFSSTSSIESQSLWHICPWNILFATVWF